MFAKRVAVLSPSPTMAMATKAKEMKDNGIDVIDLSLGDPVLDPSYSISDVVRNSVDDAMREGKVYYTQPAGILELRHAIIEKFKKDNGIEYDLQEVTIGCGAKQLIFNAFLATLDDGDDVILPCPAWVSYCEIAKLFGGNCIMLDTGIENGFKITPEVLDNAITNKTKWVVLTSPNNPTGSVYSRAELLGLIQVLKKYPHVMVMSDDIYEHLIFDKAVGFYNVVMLDHTLKNRTLVINGVSKSHGMTGWRVGYAAGNAALIKKMNILQSQSTSSVCTISQFAALAALKSGYGIAAGFVRNIVQRSKYVVDELSNTDLDVYPPEGAFYVFISIKKLLNKRFGNVIINSDDTFCELLLEHCSVATTTGRAFGAADHFRMSLASSTDSIKLAIERIKDFLTKIK